jgi:hypothetical protein
LSEVRPAAGEQKLFRSARELAATVAPKVDWIVPGFVAAGAITELTGKAKASGKTTLVLDWVHAVLHGATCMGTCATARSPVVFLTEQTEITFREALRRARLLDRDDLLVLSRWETRSRTWPLIAKLALEEARRIDARLLVVDTLAQFAGLQGDAENNSGDALAALEPLQRIAAAGLAVLVTRHERKGGGVIGESGRGSSAFTGAVDIVLSLTRPNGNHRPTLRTLEGMSRFDETPDRIVIDKVPIQSSEPGIEVWAEHFVVLGDADAVALEEAKAALAAALPLSPATGKTAGELADGTGVARSTLERALKGFPGLAHTGSGKKNDPRRYFRLPTSNGDQTSMSEDSIEHNQAEVSANSVIGPNAP